MIGILRGGGVRGDCGVNTNETYQCVSKYRLHATLVGLLTHKLITAAE